MVELKKFGGRLVDTDDTQKKQAGFRMLGLIYDAESAMLINETEQEELRKNEEERTDKY